MSFETISIVGLGYIGLPTAAMIASMKKRVIGVDINESTVATINAGKIHMVEPGLSAIVMTAVNNGFLSATMTAEPADAFLIAVPTPFTVDSNDDSIRSPDLSYIQSAAKMISAVLKIGDLVVLESTSPVGTTEQLESWLSELRPDLTFPKTHCDGSDIRIAYCPERVLPGNVLEELVLNDRIIGGLSEYCGKRAEQLYQIFVKGECTRTNARTAEMAKLTENASRDVSIAFANELSVICHELDINVWELIELANRHPRVNILQPGPGVGGHCIAVDPWFIVSKTPDKAHLIRTARQVNDAKPDFVVELVITAVNSLRDSDLVGNKPAVIALFGLAFKPDIDDLRESPAVEITKKLSLMGIGEILVVEPNIDELPNSLSSICTLVSIEEAFEMSDICVLLVDHLEFKSLDIEKLPRRHLIDLKGVWNTCQN